MELDVDFRYLKQATQKEDWKTRRKGNSFTDGLRYLLSPFLPPEKFTLTFVQNPTTRIIAEYTKLVYNTQWSAFFQGKQAGAFENILRSPEVFKEFIKFVLYFGGSRKLLMPPYKDFAAIAPMVGVLLNSEETGSRKSQGIYRIESFRTEWNSLLCDSDIQDFLNFSLSKFPRQYAYFQMKSIQEYMGVRRHSLNQLYPSVRSDPIVTVLKPEAQLLMEKNKAEEDDRERTAYVRAVCRLYLTDYLCFDYDLPPLCRNISDEVAPLLEKFSQLNKGSYVRWLWAALVPSSLRPYLAQIYCGIIALVSPYHHCIANFQDEDDSEGDEEECSVGA